MCPKNENAVIIILRYAQKKYSRSFVKLTVEPTDVTWTILTMYNRAERLLENI